MLDGNDLIVSGIPDKERGRLRPPAVRQKSPPTMPHRLRRRGAYAMRRDESMSTSTPPDTRAPPGRRAQPLQHPRGAPQALQRPVRRESEHARPRDSNTPRVPRSSPPTPHTMEPGDAPAQGAAAPRQTGQGCSTTQRSIRPRSRRNAGKLHRAAPAHDRYAVATPAPSPSSSRQHPSTSRDRPNEPPNCRRTASPA